MNGELGRSGDFYAKSQQCRGFGYNQRLINLECGFKDLGELTVAPHGTALPVRLDHSLCVILLTIFTDDNVILSRYSLVISNTSVSRYVVVDLNLMHFGVFEPHCASYGSL